MKEHDMAFQQSPGSPQELITRCSAALDAIRESEVTAREQAEIDEATWGHALQNVAEDGYAR